MKKLFNRKGETYVDVAVLIMIVAFVLIFSVNIISVVVLAQNLKTMADQIADYATAQGTTDVDSYVSDLKEKSGIDFDCSFSGTQYLSGQKVQLGDEIEVRLTHRVSILGFGNSIFPVTIRAASGGISQVYWK
jgi:hypothetical protein